jgi:uncharacterized Zn ribbon protein
MENKTWSKQLKDGKTIKEIVLSEPVMNINSWIEKCKTEGLNEDGQQLFIKCADYYNRISFDIASPMQFSKQWEKTVNK